VKGFGEARVLPIREARRPPAPPTGRGPFTAMLRQGPLDRRLGYLLRRAQLAVFQDFFATFAGFAVTPAQYAVLTLVEANPGSSQAQVADALAIKPANFVGLVRALVGRGLVRRAPVPGNRRSMALTLTDAGAELLSALHAAADAHEGRIADHLGPDVYAALLEPVARLGRLRGA
jgi:DNA-binding MarR family transcriptional regulator